MYYYNKFNNGNFNTIFNLLLLKPKPNIVVYKKAIQDLITMMTQKDNGTRKNSKGINIEENFDMAIVTIVVESIALYLSRKLDDLEKEQKQNG